MTPLVIWVMILAIVGFVPVRDGPVKELEVVDQLDLVLLLQLQYRLE